ncbi:MAG: hypothetical protein GXY36_05145 [Chloroflexi bacterium]|nr:hypothetical protein [Chloroflexota bacterium]
MSEKVLFELRVTEDEHGAHVHVMELPEWRAYHAPPRPRLFTWAELRKAFQPRPAERDLRQALDSLQGIYDDLYGHTPNPEMGS